MNLYSLGKAVRQARWAPLPAWAARLYGPRLRTCLETLLVADPARRGTAASVLGGEGGEGGLLPPEAWGDD